MIQNDPKAPASAIPGESAPASIEPINLAADPFGVDLGDEEQVAGLPGLSGLLRKVMPKGKAKPPVKGEEPPPLELEQEMDFTKPDQLLQGVEETPSAWHLQGRPAGGNINLNFYDDVRTRQTLDLVNQYEQRFKSAPTRRPVTHAETIAKSLEQETVERAIGKKPGDMWQPEEVVAIAKVMEGSAESLKNGADALNQRMQQGIQVSDEELVDFMQRYYQLVSLQEVYTGAAAQAGRLLNSFNAIGKAQGGAQYYQAVAQTLKQSGGRGTAEQVVRAMSESDVPEEVMRSAWKLKKAKAWNLILKYRYNAMLSSVRTHMANIMGSAFITLNENFIKHPLAVGYNKLEQGVRAVTPGLEQMDASQAMAWSELWAVDRAAIDGVKTGFLGAREIIAGRAIGDGKFMNEIGTRYDVAEVPKSLIGKIATSPVRLLEAEDAMFRAINYQIELSRLAKRQAMGDSTTQAGMLARYRELLYNPTEDMVRDANAYAKYTVLANDPNVYSKLLGSLASMVSSGAERHPFWRVMVPFIKTPANLLIYARDHSMPLISGRFYSQMLSKNPAERAAASARLTEAIGMISLVYSMYEDGSVTGVGHPSKHARASYREAGWRPNAIMVGDNYYELNRADPLGLMLGVTATGFDYYHASDTEQDALSIGINTVFSVAELMTDRSMLASFSDLISVIEGSAGTSTRGDVVATMATIPAIMMPGIMRDVREMADPIERQMVPEKGTAEGMWQRFKMRFKNAWPGLSEDLAPKLDWRGRVKQHQGNIFVRGLLPVRMTKRTNDPGTLALVRYDIGVTREDTMLNLPKVGLDLNLMRMDNHKGWVYNKLTELIGKERARRVDKLVGSAQWKRRDKQAETSVDVYEKLQDKLRSQMSEGRQAGIKLFLKWLDNKQFIRDSEGNKVELVESFRLKDFKQMDKLFREEQDPNTEIYQRRRRSVLPTF